ncbi:hypothetical protein [Spirosoma areae]
MKKPDHPDTILDARTTTRLLEALRAGVIDMAYFPGLYFCRCGEPADWSLVSEEETRQFRHITAKVGRDASGQVSLSRSLKLRLLYAIRAGRINLHADFSELAKAYRAVGQDWSAVSPDEKEFVLDICRRINK